MPLITAVVLVLSTCMLNVVIDTRPQFLTILVQNTERNMKTFGRTYISAGYIKYIESAGGRVVPIRYPLN
ncbi:unnamed protein product [Pocillopora meandrina]|uniref:Uncharacterized protein n=1 Tax=Pocillopora meandrina TaxID=46732 RepID=A0AAU9X688_9CNID|nr:unnamed protein product [Pocillopora meandrina]